MTTYLHGTDARSAKVILTEGFSLETRRQSDPGDFGWGIYLTDAPSRARSYGSEVLRVTIATERYARIKNPYFLEGLREVEPQTAEEKLFHQTVFEGGKMLTVKGEDREGVARRVREVFMEAGYDGIIAGPDRQGQCEVVVFRTSSILRIES